MPDSGAAGRHLEGNYYWAESVAGNPNESNELLNLPAIFSGFLQILTK